MGELRQRRSWALLATALLTAATLSMSGVALTVGRVSAECTSAFPDMPPFSVVASTARRIVVGRVVGEVDGQGQIHVQLGDQGLIPNVRLAVDEVLRGSAPATIDILGLRTRVPPGPACPDTPLIYARNGDVIAIAYGGLIAGHRYNSAAWLAGEPSGQLTPLAQRLSLDQVRRIAGRAGIDGDCNTDTGRPGDAATVRGTTFAGTFMGTRSGVQRFRVTTPYAGSVSRGVLDLLVAPCHRIDFERGRSYLVSTADPAEPTSFDTVAYRRLDHGRVTLAPFVSGVPKGGYPDALRVRTLDAALEVLVPPAQTLADVLVDLIRDVLEQLRSHHLLGTLQAASGRSAVALGIVGRGHELQPPDATELSAPQAASRQRL